MNKTMKILMLVLCFFVFAYCTIAQKKIYNITTFGAKPNVETVSTKPIQAAIDAASKNGGGMVVIPAGDFVSGTVILKNNVELYLARGARLLGSTNYDDYPRQPQSVYRSQKDDGGWYSLIYAEGAKP